MYQIIVLLFLVSSGHVSSGLVSSNTLTEENLRTILTEFKDEFKEDLMVHFKQAFTEFKQEVKEELMVHFKQACSKEEMDETTEEGIN